MEFSDLPNEKYQKLFEQFKEIEALPVKDWKQQHLLGYFVKKYKDTYGVDYQFKFNDPNPNKCYEIWRIKTLVSRLSKDPEILKSYIDWVWEEKVKKAKKRFTSISYITNDIEVNQYKMKFLFGSMNSNPIDRSSILPENFKSILHNNGFPIKTYGDLAFLWQSQKSMQSEDFNKSLLALKEIGFNETILEKIK